MPAQPQDASPGPVDERRSQGRYACSIPVRCSFDRPGFDGTGKILNGRVKSISHGGLFIGCRLLEAPGTPVHLSLQPRGRRRCIYLDGRVAWTTEHPPLGPGMGIVLDAPIAGRPFEELLCLSWREGSTAPQEAVTAAVDLPRAVTRDETSKAG